jgi:excisionase family DNA binding protein
MAPASVRGGRISAELLTQREAAEYLRVSMKTLRRLKIRRVRLTAKLTRYRREDLDAYIQGHAA